MRLYSYSNVYAHSTDMEPDVNDQTRLLPPFFAPSSLYLIK